MFEVQVQKHTPPSVIFSMIALYKHKISVVYQPTHFAELMQGAEIQAFL